MVYKSAAFGRSGDRRRNLSGDQCNEGILKAPIAAPNGHPSLISRPYNRNPIISSGITGIRKRRDSEGLIILEICSSHCMEDNDLELSVYKDLTIFMNFRGYSKRREN